MSNKTLIFSEGTLHRTVQTPPGDQQREREEEKKQKKNIIMLFSRLMCRNHCSSTLCQIKIEKKGPRIEDIKTEGII